MRQDYPGFGIGLLCRLFGRTRHAYYDRQWRIQDQGIKEDVVVQHVLEIRKELPRVGTLKLHQMLNPLLESHSLTVGRDYLFELMREHRLDIRRRKRRAATTDSRHWMHKYSNLVKDLVIDRPEQVWVSDITYVRLNTQWAYLSLVTDAYSRKIMGYALRTDLSAKGCIDALYMALGNRIYGQKLIHHSDRGSQYCSSSYVDILLGDEIAISMTENGDPYENAIAERVNGIIKSEFNLYSSFGSLEETSLKIGKSIKAYNEIRPHSSCDFLTPEVAHYKTGMLKRRWKKRAYNPMQLQSV